jgi:hypothetical protein
MKPNPKPRDIDGLSPIVLTKRCADPPLPHEARHAWAERMRRHEAKIAAEQSEAPAENDPTDSEPTP